MIASRLKSLQPRVWIFLMMLVYGGYFSILTVTRHRALMTQSFDLSVYVQALWNTLHGDFMRVTIQPGREIFFQHHFSPSMLIFVPLYALWPAPYWLLILQSFIVAGGAWPVYQIAKKSSDREGVGYAFAAVYLLFPALQAANLYDFHEITIAAPLLAWAWYLASVRRWRWFAVVAAIALGFREEAVIFTLGIGVILALHKPTRRAGVYTLIASAAWLLVLLLVSFLQSRYNMNAALYFQSRFELGATPFEALMNILRNPSLVWERIVSREKFFYVGNLFAPVGYMVFFSWESIFMVLPSLLLNLLGQFPLLFSPAQAQYNALLSPFIVITSALGYSRFARWLAGRMKFPLRFWQNLLMVYVLLLSFGYHFRLAHLPYSSYFEWPQVTERHQLADRIARQIPSGASLSAQDNLAPHASHRRDLYLFPEVNDADYIYLDLNLVKELRQADLIDLTGLVDELLLDSRYETVFEGEGLLLLRRKSW